MEQKGDAEIPWKCLAWVQYNVNVNFSISLIHNPLSVSVRNLSIPPFTYIPPLACLWKSMVRMENILPSPSVYHIEVTENRMLCYVTSSRKKKNTLLYWRPHMKTWRIWESTLNFCLFYTQKIFPEQLRLSLLEWSPCSLKRLTYVSTPLSLTMLRSQRLQLYLGK